MLLLHSLLVVYVWARVHVFACMCVCVCVRACGRVCLCVADLISFGHIHASMNGALSERHCKPGFIKQTHLANVLQGPSNLQHTAATLSVRDCVACQLLTNRRRFMISRRFFVNRLRVDWGVERPSTGSTQTAFGRAPCEIPSAPWSAGGQRRSKSSP